LELVLVLESLGQVWGPELSAQELEQVLVLVWWLAVWEQVS
jgi:hypothetical protein